MEISQCPQNLKIYMSFDPVFPLLVILEHISKGMVIRMFTEVLFSVAKTNKQTKTKSIFINRGMPHPSSCGMLGSW